MPYVCYSCASSIDSICGTNASIARKETCPKCHLDLHCCLQCKNYDPAAYNSCRDPQAERVLDKERSNFCDHFRLRESGAGKATQDGLPSARSKALAELDNLFKK